jgi:hypothetical protein
MSGKIPFALPVFLIIAQLAAADGPPPAAPASNSAVLLLRNGQVIEGHIERNGDYYAVTGPDQEIQIRVSSVELLCRDLRDGYERKKAGIPPDDIQQHLQLLLWCERHGLLDCARQQLDTVEALDHDHPMIAVLRRRLKIESQPVTGPAHPAEKVQPPPTDEVLDHMTRDMPPGTVELFVQVVQPILLNHYPGARGYSLPNNKSLQLMRPALGETPGRRITQRNLYAVLQCIDFSNPGESPMLKATSGSPSGTAGSGFPAKYSSQYQKLSQWVYLVAQKQMPDEGGADNASFADLASGDSASPRTRPSTHMLYHAPGSVKGQAGEGTSNDSDVKDFRAGKDKPDAEGDGTGKPAADRHAKPKTAFGNSDSAHSQPRMPADRAAAQAIDSVDPYDPAAFNNQSDAPTQMPTPAARVLQGGGRP